ncbi:hypothetical protein [Parasedimentitalea huanghaiensis]|uniref:PH domain-containing protein n=1 Tax=Parasedimentitalea huanghaiensis TaxID=2682100 RepID=A0A6L6WBD7_9RHOB|nr:hypothetical protein [Zongyanglinia huanghaiensis]MVO15143.1 hypothetical protein [Zongyanglinia huanghaiensis]
MPETQFTPDRTAYIRSHAWMAALAMAAGMVILWAMGNPHVWTGAIGGLGAIILRGWYLMSEEMAVVWTLADTSLTGPAERNIPLAQIERVHTMGSYVQVVTKSGDKHLIKYQADPDATSRIIESARR